MQGEHIAVDLPTLGVGFTELGDFGKVKHF